MIAPAARDGKGFAPIESVMAGIPIGDKAHAAACRTSRRR
jgi:hypothetical protein